MDSDDLDRVVPLDQLDDLQVAAGEPDVRGWDVIAADGRRIGEVDQLLVDTAARRVRYLDVGLDGALAGRPNEERHVLIPIGYAYVDPAGDRVVVDTLESRDVAGLPEYHHGPLTRDFETTLRRRIDAGYTGSLHTDPEFYQAGLYDDSRFFGTRRPREELR
jgi:sporulation protein YlmC with PRC-barrel domain